MAQFSVVVRGNSNTLIENFFGAKFFVTNEDFDTLKTGGNQTFSLYGHRSKRLNSST